MRRILLGYDVLAVPALAAWAVEGLIKREAFFIRPDVDWPISVDRVTCPSIFQPEFRASGETRLVLTRFPKKQAQLPTELIGVRAITRRIPDWSESAMNPLGFWNDLDNMLIWTKQRPELRDHIRFAVAVQIVLTEQTDSDALWDAVSAGRVDPAIMQDWLRLGYDVGDHDQTSALSGFEYTSDEMAQTRSQWIGHVNQWGLLDDLESALAFRESANSRILEHAPFYVYEIFKIHLKE